MKLVTEEQEKQKMELAENISTKIEKSLLKEKEVKEYENIKNLLKSSNKKLITRDKERENSAGGSKEQGKKCKKSKKK